MTGSRVVAVSWLTLIVSAGCQILGGFEDFSENCPAGASACRDGGTGGAGGRHPGAPEAGAGGSRAAGGATASAGTGNGGAPSSGGSSAPDGSPEPGRCPHGTDPGSHGPAMAEVMRPDGSCFWIDTTEVTVAEYADFVRAPHPLPEDGVCAWNSLNSTEGGALGSAGFVPPAECARRVPGGLSLTDGGAGPNATLGQPVTCVDWCDALAFCVWAGKDLCSDDGDSADVPDKSDWDDACTEGQAANLYGCGPGCHATACNGASSLLGHLAPAGATPGCSVTANDGKTRIQDLSGNVSEWTGWCNPETADGQCLTRGGGYASSDSTLECGSTVRLARQSVSPTVGFRCCAAVR